MRTVFHVTTEEQLSYVDAKVRNLLADGTVEIERAVVVVDAPGAIDAAAGRLRGNAEGVLEAGGGFEVCSNAVRGAASSPDDLPEGVETVPSAVGQLTRLQSEGYAYVRP